MGVVFRRLKGFADIYGEQADKFSRMEETAERVFSLYAFKELRTPILEMTELFQRSIGAETDVVQKEMFTFADRKGRSVTLRPEATAGVMRSAIENGFIKGDGGISKYYTIGPMFRYERPQKGRMRQFHQINCEMLGSSSPYADASMICMLLDFLENLRIPALTLKLNFLGCRECRPGYVKELKGFLQSMDPEGFCEDCRKRSAINPLRVLDCKIDSCRELTADVPKLMDHSCEECRQHSEEVMELLSGEGIAFEIDHRLVRGLDYYSRTTFEVTSEAIGAQTAVAGGGRYDGLISQLGGEDAPGIGFACGMERLALLMPEKAVHPLDFYMIVLENKDRPLGFSIVQQLRRRGLAGEMNYKGGGMRSLMRHAAKSGASYCLALGPDEAAAGLIAVKEMEKGEQRPIPMDEIGQYLEQKISESKTS